MPFIGTFLIMKEIGLFDSGVGGTTIWRAVVEELPWENTVFLADSINAPYGNKSKEEIVELCQKNTEFLLNRGCKIIVVACNTATTSAISHLREKYEVPFIGIEPAIRPASLNSKTKVVGVLATKGTLGSELFHKTKQKQVETGIEIVEQVGYGLVEMVENGEIEGEKVKKLLEQYLKPMVEKNIDHLVLGCTHFPYLRQAIEQVLPKNVKVIDSAKAVARQTRVVLEEKGLVGEKNNIPKHIWLNTKDEKILSRFKPKDIEVEIKKV